MCGIAAIYNKNQTKSFLKDSIIRMISSLSHRGPDESGVFITNNLALGQRRLSIIDLEGGNQPMITDRYVIVYNGEIFNYIELREELQQKENICVLAAERFIVSLPFCNDHVCRFVHIKKRWAALTEKCAG